MAFFIHRGGDITEVICKRAVSISFWDNYARWYHQWLTHNNYHDKILSFLNSFVKPEFKVIDVGAGSGVLSIPLAKMGCFVTALEPSLKMRDLLYREIFKKGVYWLKVDDRRFEDLSIFEISDYDLILACNSFHLSELGIDKAVEKAFMSNTKYILLVTEIMPSKDYFTHRNYNLIHYENYYVDSCFAYHSLGELKEHFSLITGKPLKKKEFLHIKKKLVLEKRHLWLKEKANVKICLWNRMKFK